MRARIIQAGREPVANDLAWAIGYSDGRRFHVRRIVWGRALARVEKRASEVIRKAIIVLPV